MFIDTFKVTINTFNTSFIVPYLNILQNSNIMAFSYAVTFGSLRNSFIARFLGDVKAPEDPQVVCPSS